MAFNKKPPLHAPKRKPSRQTALTSVGENVGRGHAPKSTQFQKGVSGNPKGRPTGSKNLNTLLREAAERPVRATIEGKQRTITLLHGIVLQLAEKALRGDHRAMAKFLDKIDEIERRAEAERPANFPFSPKDCEILSEMHRQMQACTDMQDFLLLLAETMSLALETAPAGANT